MSVDNPELETPVRILHDLWESAQGKEPRITKYVATRRLDAYYKAQASKDIAEVIGKDVPLDGGEAIRNTSGEIKGRGAGSYMESCRRELRAEQRKTAVSKGYKVEEENLNG